MQTVLHCLSHTLSEIYPEKEAFSIAKLLLSEGLGWGTLLLYTGKDSNLSDEERQKVCVFLDRLMRYEPVQYVLGKTQFCGYSFDVAPGVLIPRPETEELVLEIQKDWQSFSSVSLLDVGTGSGCIAITLSLEMKNAKVDAWDISSDALVVARQNNRNLGASVHFFEKDLREGQPEGDSSCKYDILVSNPPYVLEKERNEMDPNVLEWEPPEALFVPDEDPLVYYRCICQIGCHSLKPGGGIYFEINSQFGPEIVALMREMGYVEIQLKKDRFGNDRIAKGRR